MVTAVVELDVWNGEELMECDGLPEEDLFDGDVLAEDGVEWGSPRPAGWYGAWSVMDLRLPPTDPFKIEMYIASIEMEGEALWMFADSLDGDLANEARARAQTILAFAQDLLCQHKRMRDSEVRAEQMGRGFAEVLGIPIGRDACDGD